MWVVVAAGFALCVFGDGKRHLPCLRDITEESGLGKVGNGKTLPDSAANPRYLGGANPDLCGMA